MIGTSYIVYLAVLSVLTCILYGVDKAKAKAGAWRIPENTLLLCGLMGGAPGALIGMRVFHHKTKHWYFYAINFAGLVMHIGLLVWMLVG